MPDHGELFDRIRALAPDLVIEDARVSDEGAANVVVVVNEDWVFRFARNEGAREDLAREAKILSLLPHHVDLPVPEARFFPPDAMRQRKLHGEPLDRATLLRQPPAVQEYLVEQLAHFLFQLHRVPTEELDAAGIGDTKATVGHADAVELFHTVEREVFPHLKGHVRQVVIDHFAPVLSGKLDLSYEPVLIHADLNPSHLLWDPQRARLAGVLDFGMAGRGDSAIDYAFIILVYGETPLRRMKDHHPGIAAKIDRARFWALAIELQFVLTALRTREPRWLVGHIGSARDLLPIGTPWD